MCVSISPVVMPLAYIEMIFSSMSVYVTEAGAQRFAAVPIPAVDRKGEFEPQDAGEISLQEFSEWLKGI